MTFYKFSTSSNNQVSLLFIFWMSYFFLYLRKKRKMKKSFFVWFFSTLITFDYFFFSFVFVTWLYCLMFAIAVAVVAVTVFKTLLRQKFLRKKVFFFCSLRVDWKDRLLENFSFFVSFIFYQIFFIWDGKSLE